MQENSNPNIKEVKVKSEKAEFKITLRRNAEESEWITEKIEMKVLESNEMLTVKFDHENARMFRIKIKDTEGNERIADVDDQLMYKCPKGEATESQKWNYNGTDMGRSAYPEFIRGVWFRQELLSISGERYSYDRDEGFDRLNEYGKSIFEQTDLRRSVLAHKDLIGKFMYMKEQAEKNANTIRKNNSAFPTAPASPGEDGR